MDVQRWNVDLSTAGVNLYMHFLSVHRTKNQHVYPFLETQYHCCSRQWSCMCQKLKRWIVPKLNYSVMNNMG